MKFTTTKARTIIIVLASLLLFCTIAAVLPVMADAVTPKYNWTGETVADKYSYGQTFAVPERRLDGDRKSTRLNSSHNVASRMPSSA